ncbi:hypothetical protein [Veillonella caviae]|uniref:hypothetical protein n=1 Tax=Veillonella caviae TaxID=248316 RepID=UPI0023F8FA87|nr:hypothetical protein [Veillonella caviae]
MLKKVRSLLVCAASILAFTAVSQAIIAADINQESITLRGQIEGYYDNEFPRFVTEEGRTYAFSMKHSGAMLSYQPFVGEGYIDNNQLMTNGDPVFIVKKVVYDDPTPNVVATSILPKQKVNTAEQGMSSFNSRDPGYYHAPIVSASAAQYQQNMGNLGNQELSQYQYVESLDNVEIGSKVYVLGSLVKTETDTLMSFRLADNRNKILVNRNGAIIPIGQRVTIAGIVSAPGVLTVNLVYSMA